MNHHPPHRVWYEQLFEIVTSPHRSVIMPSTKASYPPRKPIQYVFTCIWRLTYRCHSMYCQCCDTMSFSQALETQTARSSPCYLGTKCSPIFATGTLYCTLSVQVSICTLMGTPRQFSTNRVPGTELPESKSTPPRKTARFVSSLRQSLTALRAAELWYQKAHQQCILTQPPSQAPTDCVPTELPIVHHN